MIGTIKWYSAAKGYGFISAKDGGPDIFVHVSALKKANLESLEEGTPVNFDLESRSCGRSCACNLRLT